MLALAVAMAALTTRTPFPRTIHVDPNSKTPISDALKVYNERFLMHPIRSLECPETPEATKDKFTCEGVMVDGGTFTLEVTHEKYGSYNSTGIVYHGPEFGVREAIEPRVPGDILEFDCPEKIESGQSAKCSGTTEDGTKFTVGCYRDEQGMMHTATIDYAGSQRTKFLTGVRDTLRPSSAIRTIECRVDTDDIPCTAHLDDNVTIRFVAERNKLDGSLQLRNIVKETPPNDVVKIAPIIPLMIGMTLLLIGVVKAIGLRDELVVARVPVVAEQTVRFDAPDRYGIQVQGPFFSMMFFGVRYWMWDVAHGREVETWSTGGAKSSTVQVFDVKSAGEYLFRILNLNPNRDTTGGTITFSRSWPARGFFYVLIAIIGGLSTAAGMVALVVMNT